MTEGASDSGVGAGPAIPVRLQRRARRLLAAGATFEETLRELRRRGAAQVSVEAVQDFFRSSFEVQRERVERRRQAVEELKRALTGPHSLHRSLAEAALLDRPQRTDRVERARPQAGEELQVAAPRPSLEAPERHPGAARSADAPQSCEGELGNGPVEAHRPGAGAEEGTSAAPPGPFRYRRDQENTSIDGRLARPGPIARTACR